MRDSFRRRVRAMRRCKGVVHVEIAQFGKLLGKCGVVAFFAGVEADVFEQEHVAVAQLRHRAFGHLADAIARKADGKAEAIRKRSRDRPQRELRIRFAVGSPEMREHDGLRAVLVQPAQRRQRGVDATIIGNPCPSVILSLACPELVEGSKDERDVQILAHENAPAANVALLQASKGHYVAAGIVDPTKAVSSARRHQ